MLSALVLSLLFLSSDPAPATATGATEEPASTATTETAAAEDKSRLVCRREAKANSRFTTKVCKTTAEWEAQAEAARAAFAETQQRPVINIGRGN